MNYVIEITGLTPKIDPATLQMQPGMILMYKKPDNKFEQMELTGSTLDVMNMLSIKNLSDAIGVKYNMETGPGNKDISFSRLDTRVFNYNDFERLEKKVNEVLTLLRKHSEQPVQN